MAKKMIEHMLQHVPHGKVLNASKRGAKIEGAPFKPLDEIMSDCLVDKIVDEEWYKTDSTYFPHEYLKKRNDKMSLALEQLKQRFEQIETILERLRKIGPFNRQKQIEQELNAFEKKMEEINRNDFYVIFIRPMLMIETAILSNNMAKIRAEKDYAKRAQYVVEEFGRLISESKFNLNRIALPLYNKINQDILEYIANKGDTTQSASEDEDA
jgi:hypothetical protein